LPTEFERSKGNSSYRSGTVRSLRWFCAQKSKKELLSEILKCEAFK
jgi:hypothetical protein